MSEPFSSAPLATTVVSPLPGSNAHDTGFPSIGAPSGSCSGCIGDVWRDNVQTLFFGSTYTTTLSYSPGSFLGFGANWDTGPASEGTGLTITVNYEGGGTTPFR